GRHGKTQAKGAGGEGTLSAGCLLFVGPARGLSAHPAAAIPHVCARWLARANFSGGRSADITAGADVWFHAARGMALRIDASPPLIPAHSASLRAFTPVFDGLWTRVNALMLGIQSPVLVLWVPATGSPRQQKRVYARL